MWRAAAGTCLRTGVRADWMSVKVGSCKLSTSMAVKLSGAAARASGRHVGWTPWRADTLRPQTKHRVRPWACIQDSGTSPLKVPDKRASMWDRMEASWAQPGARAESEQRQLGTGQKTGADVRPTGPKKELERAIVLGSAQLQRQRAPDWQLPQSEPREQATRATVTPL